MIENFRMHNVVRSSIWVNAAYGYAGLDSPLSFQVTPYTFPTFEDDDGLATGLYREVTGTAFPTAITWWTTSGKTQMVKSIAITRNGNQTPATVTYTFYNSAGVAMKVFTDTITYSGVFETSRARVIT
jgi:hypothetical protein